MGCAGPDDQDKDRLEGGGPGSLHVTGSAGLRNGLHRAERVCALQGQCAGRISDSCARRVGVDDRRRRPGGCDPDKGPCRRGRGGPGNRWAPEIVQYLGLFCVLVVIYSIYMKGIITGPDGGEVSAPFGSLAKFCLISALPFGVLACSDQPWRSSDAAPVSVAAWIAVFYAFSLKYPGQCPFSAFLLFVPLVLSALLGHTVGMTCRWLFHFANSSFVSTPNRR